MRAEWYYAENGQQLGPVTWVEMLTLADSGRVRAGDLVWRDGMPDWVHAGSVPGLCRGPQAPYGQPPDARAAHAPAPYAESATGTGEAWRGAAPDHDGYNLEQRPAPRLVNEDGTSPGIKIAYWIAGGVAGLVVLGVVLYLALRGTVRTGPGTYVIVLAPGQDDNRHITFRIGQNVSISVTSQVTQPNTDVDLYVYARNQPNPMAQDTNSSKDARVNFFSPQTQTYRVRVLNLGPGRATCTVTHN